MTVPWPEQLRPDGRLEPEIHAVVRLGRDVCEIVSAIGHDDGGRVDLIADLTDAIEGRIIEAAWRRM